MAQQKDFKRDGTMSKAIAAAYVVAVLILMVAASRIGWLRCENFGCMGIGVAWFAWSMAFMPVLAVGAALRWRCALGPTLGKVVGVFLWVQVAVGVALLATWVARA